MDGNGKWYVATGAVLVGMVWFLTWLKPDLLSFIVGGIIGLVAGIAIVVLIVTSE